MSTAVFFKKGVAPLPAGAADQLPLVRILFDGDHLEVEADNGVPYKIEDVNEGVRWFARLTSLQTNEEIVLSDETRTGPELGMGCMVEKIEHMSFATREQVV